MPQQTINNLETFSSVRGKMNSNFTELYTNSLSGSTTNNYIVKGDGSNRTLVNSSIFDNGNVGIGTASTGARLTIAAGTTTAAPLGLTSGTNLTTPAAGSIEYNGTIFTATPNTSFRRATIPTTVYTSGQGPNLTLSADATPQNLFPTANDTITLPLGTYLVKIKGRIVRGNITNGTPRHQIRLTGGTAAGTFNGNVICEQNGGAPGYTNIYDVDSVALTTYITVDPAVSSGGAGARTANFSVDGILKITTAGTLIPQYRLSANGTGATTQTTANANNFMIIQALDSQNNTAFGPAGAGWS